MLNLDDIESDLAGDIRPNVPQSLYRAVHVVLSPVWFALDWFHSRNWLALLLSTPALIVGGTATAILAIGKSTPDKYWLDTYSQRAVSALRANNTAAAEVYFRRLIAMNASDPASIYGLAMTAARAKDEERARLLMQSIAPDNARGYAPAHFWVAKDILTKGGRIDAHARELLEHHLSQSLVGGQDNTEADALLGQLFALRGNIEGAIPHLVRATGKRPELLLMLSDLYARQKNMQASRSSALAARDFFEKQTRADAKKLKARIYWAESEVMLQNHNVALEVLREGLNSSDPKMFRAAIIDFYIRWYASVPENDPKGLIQRLELLNSALTYGPNDSRLLTLLADLATRDWDRAGEASATLTKALAAGTAPPTVHAILGTQALLKGDVETARTHLELAHQGDLGSPTLLNNLAWALANRKDPDLERALELAQAAKKLMNHPEISDTLGTILARMGRNREAISELEIALHAFPDRAELHGKLADLYQAVGDADLAQLHRQLAGKAKKES